MSGGKHLQGLRKTTRTRWASWVLACGGFLYFYTWDCSVPTAQAATYQDRVADLEIFCKDHDADRKVATAVLASVLPEFATAEAYKSETADKILKAARQSVKYKSPDEAKNSDIVDILQAEQRHICYLEAIYTIRQSPYFHCSLALLYINYGKKYKLYEKRELGTLGFAEARALLYGEQCIEQPKFSFDDDTPKRVQSTLPRREAAKHAQLRQGFGWPLVGLGVAAIVGSVVLSALHNQPTGSNTCVSDGVQGPCIYKFVPLLTAGYIAGGLSLGGGAALVYFGRKLHKDYHSKDYRGN